MKKNLSRRNFIKGLGYTTCGGLVHGVGSSIMTPMRAMALSDSRALAANSTLVMLNFRGGWPLNIVPQGDGYWIDAFEDLANIDTALALDGNQFLHPSLTALKTIWDEGNLALVNNVGYYNPALGVGVNRSHSDSTDIFFGGIPTQATPTEGWAVRFTNLMTSVFGGISVGGTNLLTDNGPNLRSFGDLGSLGEEYFGWGKNGEWWRDIRNQLLSLGEYENLGKVPLIRQANTNIDTTLATLQQQTSESTNPLPDAGLFPNSGFGNQLRDLARILNAPVLGTQFCYAEDGGYDTHNGERDSLTNNLNNWNNAVSAFITNLKAMGRWDRTVIVTMADFGRTTFRNGSGGTDHGHALTWLIFGGGVRGGIKTPRPTQADLTSGGSFIQTVHVQFPSLLNDIVSAIGYDGNAIFPGYGPAGLNLFL